MDKLKCMRAFAATVESGSFAAAAERLSLSPQRVAKAVSQLEQQLTLSLLQRTTRQQSLTEFGHLYYARCREILNQLDTADAIAWQMRDQPQGNIRISAPVTFGNACLVEMICRFLDDFPAIDVTLELSDHLERLEDNASDVAFRIGDVLDPGRVAKPLNPYQLITCASPAYLAKRGIPNTPGDLITHDCLIYSWSTDPTNNIWIFSHHGQRIEQAVQGRLRVNDSEGLLQAALAGRGILMAAEPLVKPHIESGALLPLLVDFNPPARPMHLLYTVELKRRAKVQLFIDAAMRWFAPT